MPNLVLFDIDGTILRFKTYKSHEIFSAMFREIFGYDVPLSVMPDFSGMTDLQILKEIACKIELPFIDIEKKLPLIWTEISKKYDKYFTSGYMYILPGISELLPDLYLSDKITLGLVTGNFKQNAYMKLKAFDFDGYFPVGAFGCDHEDRNKLPSIAILRANEFCGTNVFSKSNTLIIGDSPRDIECAKSNNLPVLAVATGSYNKESLAEYNPDVVLNDFSDYIETKKVIFELLNII